MKNFTSFLTIFFIALSAQGQNPENLQQRIEKAQEKFSLVKKHAELFIGRANKNVISSYLFEPGTKSAVAIEKLDSTVTKIFNFEEAIWVNNDKSEFFYNALMKNTLWLDKEWNMESKTWDIYGKSELGYNSQGVISSMIIHNIDDFSGELVKETKLEAFYGQDSKLDSILSFAYESDDSWILETKQIYHYNASGKLIQVNMQSYDEEDEMSMKYSFSYDSFGNIISSETYYLIEENEMLFYKTNYSYDGLRKRIESEDWRFSFVTSLLEKSGRTVYQYTAAGDVSMEIYSSWYEDAWIEEDKDEYIYSNTNFSEIAWPSFMPLITMGDEINLTFNKVLTKINTYGMIEGNWTPTEITTFYYSEGTSSNVPEVENASVLGYPNPATESVTFNWNGGYEQLTIELYQINGAKVLKYNIFPGKAIPVSHLNNGIYFYKLLNGEKTIHTGKLIKN